MAGKNLVIQSVLTFVILLLVALCLQSLVVLFLGLQGAVRSELALAEERLRALAGQLTSEGPEGTDFGLLSLYPEEVGRDASCLLVEVNGRVTELGRCPHGRQVRALLQLAGRGPVVDAAGRAHLFLDYAGATWQLFFYRSESALLALPLGSDQGQVRGSIAVEHSLLPVYARLQRDGQIALAYLLATLLICTSLFYLRQRAVVFLPLLRLVQLTENYRPEDEALFYPGVAGGLLRRLSTGMNGMIQRIREDNLRLRASIERLEVANRELEEKKDLLVRSEKLASVGRLSAGLAHEIGNPLAIIQGYVDLLSREDCNAEERANFSSKAQQELDRIQALSRRLLDFARPRPTTTLVAVNDLVIEVLGFIAVEKSFAGCRLDKQLDARRDLLLADPDALRQVLINCLFNAADAMAGCPEGEREIRLATANLQGTQHGEMLLLTIADRGPGVAAAQLEEIFEPFSSTKETGKGTGLGLFVCQTIVEGLGGTIRAENRTGGGLVIRIELPLPVEELNDSR